MQKELDKIDHEIQNLIELENKRQQTCINLIASENYTSDQILKITGCVLTNKYAEGYPGKRYYAGCEIVDKIENIAINRCKELFKATDYHINVQPHSGSQANMAVYSAILKPGDCIMGMSLSSGGHLTHGHHVNFSGSIYETIQYEVDRDTQEINYQQIRELAYKYKPKIIIAGASAYSRIIDFKEFSDICQENNAYLLADIAHIAGLIAAKLHPSPIGYADFITSTTHKTLRGPRSGFIMCKKEYANQIDRAIIPGIQGGPFMHVIAAKATCFKEALHEDFKIYQKQVLANSKAMSERFKSLGYKIVSNQTDNHLFVIDLRSKNITGKMAQDMLNKFNIIVSRSSIPFDTEKPWITSGIRIGTPAITTKGFKEQESILIAEIIAEILENPEIYPEKLLKLIN